MRIAHVSDVALPRVGGIEMHIAGLADRQRAAGHDVEVVTAFDGNGRPWQRARPSAIARTSDVVRAGAFDVVHVHSSLFSPLALGVAASSSRAGLPTVVTAHSLVSRYEPVLRGLDALTRWTRWPVAWTAVSELAAAPLRRLVGDGTAVSVLPNATDLDRWRVSPTPRDPECVVVASVLRLAARKRPMALVRALRLARASVPGNIALHAVVVGDGPQRGRLERYCARHGMGKWVHFTGPLSHDAIRCLYRRADLFVNPGVLESFGIAALEARAAGLPVVAMRDSGVTEFVAHGRSGLLVDSDPMLAGAIATLASDANFRARIAAYNRRVTPSFDWSSALERTERAYMRAAGVHETHRSRRAMRGIVTAKAQS